MAISSSDASEYIKELQTLRKCSSDNIVACYGAFVNNGEISICLEYMNSGSLEDVSKKGGPISEEILGQVTLNVKQL